MPEPVELSTPPVPAPPLETPPVEQPADSIAAHQASFGPQADNTPPAVEPVTGPRERHRAKSQQATAADVPRINELTRKLRDAQAELYRLRASAPARVEPPPSVKPTAAAATPTPAPPASGFTDPMPVLTDFTAEDDPYLALNRAMARWDRRKDAFEEKQAKDAETAATSADEAERQVTLAYQERLGTFIESHPDFNEKIQAAIADDPSLGTEQGLSSVLMHAICTDDNGPAIMYHLLTHPVELDEMRLRAAALPPTQDSVALLRRRLRPYATQAAPTGSAAGVPSQSLAPRPPNPVRTGPMKTGTDTPGEQGSIADHARTFSPQRRR